ncbi:hypothetical protein E1B28_011818 [Marasmius oreades]|uniref:Protein kinase domain-containing protein n=1 Tax=Marasmius oreades TaxID=181124 RepID=A0A9P7RVJ6_9AGAR|nr:uncharacterized protein E1B28_011818 [Marasmius oreades]KAG7090217.1 hypothetical protein E1B28_011818 [Marasmius oreades]
MHSPSHVSMNLARLYSLRRPSNLNEIRRVVETVLGDKQQSSNLLQTKGDDAQIWLDTLQVLAEVPDVGNKLRSSILKVMLHLSKRSGLCPQCLMIKNVKRLGDFPVEGGGFGDVWKGKIGAQVVCLKVVKVYLVSDVRGLLKEYMREAIVWQQLKHPNVLPFMGMYYLDKARGQLCLVSPWMERGNLVRFLKETRREDIDYHSLVYDVASGLLYLHGMKIVHGDLKGVNILITPDERACIGDFGLSRVADTHALRLTSSTTIHSKGTTRWLSPEILKSDPPCPSSMSSDIYAFACVCYEIFMGNVPFYELTDGAVIVAVLLDKKVPSRPRSKPLNDDMWNIMVSCWKTEAHLRPSASEVFARLDGIKSSKTGSNVEPASAWDTSDLTQLWKNVKYPLLDTAALVRLQKKLSRTAPVQLANVGRVVEDMQDMHIKAEFNAALKIVERWDKARRKNELDFAYLDLGARVADWREAPLHSCGQLILHATLVYISSNFSYEYRVFLFKEVVLFCWDPTPARYHFAVNGDIVLEPGQAQRPITIRGLTDLKAIVKAQMAEIVGESSVQYMLNIWWKAYDRSGDYSLQFPRKNQMQEWHSTINSLIHPPDTDSSDHGPQTSLYPSPPTTPSSDHAPEPNTVSTSNASELSRVAGVGHSIREAGRPLPPLPDTPSSFKGRETEKTNSTSSQWSRTAVISHSDSIYVVENKPAVSKALVQVKVHFLLDIFLLDVSPSIRYEELAAMICQRIYSCGVYRGVRSILIDWENEKEFGRWVTLISDADVRRALGEAYEEGTMSTLHVS